MNELEKLHDWLSRSASTATDISTIHIDRLSELEGRSAHGIELAKVARELLLATAAFCDAFPISRKIRTVVIYLPLATTTEMMLWHTGLWDEVGGPDESPALYLLRDSQVFDEDSEEYRKPISLPWPEPKSISATFRSFRGADAIANCWEFSSGIYLVLRLQ